MNKNSAELPCKDKKIILRNPRKYKLEEPFRIQDSYARPQAINQSRRSEFYKYTRLPVTRWVKLSLNFELLVP